MRLSLRPPLLENLRVIPQGQTPSAIFMIRIKPMERLQRLSRGDDLLDRGHDRWMSNSASRRKYHLDGTVQVLLFQIANHGGRGSQRLLEAGTVGDLFGRNTGARKNLLGPVRLELGSALAGNFRMELSAVGCPLDLLNWYGLAAVGKTAVACGRTARSGWA